MPRGRVPAIAFALGMVSLALGCVEPSTPEAQGDSSVEALLRLHHEHRAGHVLRAPGRLLTSFADPLVEVSRGAVTPRSRGESERRFEGYLAGARFLEWEDVTPPLIHLSSDGTMAMVAVEKRVRALIESPDSGVLHDARRFAWTGTWQRGEEGWRLVAIASTDRMEPDPEPVSLAERSEAYEILDGAREAVGGQAAVAAVATLSFMAAGEGPRGPFTTRVRSSRDGRAFFRQTYTDPERSPVAAGIALAGAWRVEAHGDVVDSLSTAERRFLRGHELHLLAIAPESRFHDPRAAAREAIAGHLARTVRFLAPDGVGVRFFYHPDTGVPLGFRLRDPPESSAAPVVALFDDWRAVGPVRLPFRIVFTQAEEAWDYQVTEASTDWLPDQAFGPASR